MSLWVRQASTQLLAYQSAVISTRPITVSAWVYVPSFTGTHMKIFAIDNDDPAGNFYYMSLNANTAYWYVGDGSGSSVASTAYINTNQWYHICAKEIATNSRAILVNGGSKGTSTTTKGDPVVDMTGIGAGMGAADYDYHFNGLIADLCVWGAALSDSEIFGLYKGAHPKSIRRNDIALYLPLEGYDYYDAEHNIRFSPVNGPTIGGPAPLNRPIKRLFSGVTLPTTTAISKVVKKQSTGSFRFASASSQFMESASAVLTTVPITMACWFYATTGTSNKELMSLGSTTNQDCFVLRAQSDELVSARTFNAGVSASAYTTSTFSLNTWHHACGVWINNNTRNVFLNGGNDQLDTETMTPTGINTTTIGAYMYNGSNGNYMDGCIAEACIWDVVLTVGEIIALHKGVHPTLIRPNNLKFYLPLNTFNLRDEIGGIRLTAYNNPTISGGPTINRPYDISFSRLVASVGIVWQYARPSSDISSGNWEPSVGGSLYAVLDEITPDDNDYIITENPSTDQCEVALTSLADPQTGSNHTIRYRIKKVGLDTINLTFYLMEGTTQIATWAENDISTSIVQTSYTLSSAEADSITNYSNLRVRVTANKV